MIRLLPLLLLLTACTPAHPDWPLPEWRINGSPVQYEHTYQHIATSQLRGGICVIGWNPDRWDEMESVERVFILTHEIHHCRISLDNPHLSQKVEERAADCEAVKWMRDSDYLPDTWLANLCAIVSEWKGDDTHDCGTMRAINILQCGMEP